MHKRKIADSETYNFLAKSNAFYDPNTVVDKPHNIYLQIATNTGVLSLLALLAVWGIYFISSLKLYSKIKFDSLSAYIGASCLVSIIGYLTAGVFNDHIVSVSPLFWITLGFGISINLKIKRDTAQIKN